MRTASSVCCTPEVPPVNMTTSPLAANPKLVLLMPIIPLDTSAPSDTLENPMAGPS